LVDGFCWDHKDELASLLSDKFSECGFDNPIELTEPLESVPSNSDSNFIEAIRLRESAYVHSSKFTLSSFSQDLEEVKVKYTDSFSNISDIEIAQLYFQFKLFDIDNDGIISLEDLKSAMLYIDPRIGMQHDDAWVTRKAKEYFGPVFNTDANISIEEYTFNMNFPGYVESVHKFRETLVESKILYDPSLYPFWSLRDCLFYSSNRLNLNGTLWKRGNAFAKGSMNSWKKRYFKMITDPNTKSRITLQYSESDTEDASIKGTIDLRNVNSFDFSPKTVFQNPENKDEKLVVFKLLMNDGRRYVFASDKDTAIYWGSAFTWFSGGGKLVNEWVENFGEISKDLITLRDWVNAAMVIIRIQRYRAIREKGKQEIEEAGKKTSTIGTILGLDDMFKRSAIRRAKKKLAEDAMTCKPTEHDYKKLKICKIDHRSLDDSIKVIQAGLEVWKYSKDYLIELDNSMCGGGIGYSVIAIKNAILAYNMARDAKNSYNKHKYEVDEWVSKGSVRDCAVCKTVFKSLTLRKEFAKHHCRACGRVVCHSCSTNKIIFEVSGKPGRICHECLLNGKSVVIIENKSAESVKSGGEDEPVPQEKCEEDEWI